MRNARRLSAAAIVAVMAIVAACEEAAAPPTEIVRPVRATKVGDTETIAKRWFTGRAKATREVDLAFRVAGPVVELPVKIGDAVAKGDKVARLDPAPFRADVDGANAALKRAQATLKNANIELERSDTLYKQGHIAKARLDSDTAAADVASAEVSSARASLQRAQLDLDYTVLQTPFDGIVVATYVENFEEVQAKQAVMRIVNADQIEMVVDIPENLISAAPKVKTVIVVFDAYPDHELIGTIKEIGTEASETTRTYPVTLIMDQPDDIKILPGMAGKATGGEVDESLVAEQGGLEIPLGATFTEGEDGATFVWVVDETSQVVSKRGVEVREIGDLGLRVASGVMPGEWIVTAGVHSLRDGQKVRLLTE